MDINTIHIYAHINMHALIHTDQKHRFLYCSLRLSDMLKAEPKALTYARQTVDFGVTTLIYLHCQTQIHCHFKASLWCFLKYCFNWGFNCLCKCLSYPRQSFVFYVRFYQRCLRTLSFRGNLFPFIIKTNHAVDYQKEYTLQTEDRKPLNSLWLLSEASGRLVYRNYSPGEAPGEAPGKLWACLAEAMDFSPYSAS